MIDPGTMKNAHGGFTLTELIVSMSILTVLVLMVARMLDSAATVTGSANKRMETDSQARPLFDRIWVDITQMVKRTDVSYHFKSGGSPMPGNDLLAFYTSVPGYSATTPASVSVVAYRVNSDSTNTAAFGRLERMGRGLPWSGSPSGETPMVFLPLTLAVNWPSVESNTDYDSPCTYEVIGPQVFRFEYSFVDRATGVLIKYPSGWSSATAIAVKDASALAVSIAVVDSRSRVIMSNSDVETLTGRLPDYSDGMAAGELLGQWQSAIDSTTDIPRTALTGIRLYERYFYLSP